MIYGRARNSDKCSHPTPAMDGIFPTSPKDFRDQPDFSGYLSNPRRGSLAAVAGLFADGDLRDLLLETSVETEFNCSLHPLSGARSAFSYRPRWFRPNGLARTSDSCPRKSAQIPGRPPEWPLHIPALVPPIAICPAAR